MSYFMAPQSHPSGLLSSGQGGAATPSSSFGHSSPAEPVMVVSGGLAPLSQKTEQVAPATQAWGPVPTMPEARGCPGGAGWELLRQESGRYCPKLPPGRPLERPGWEDAGPGSRGPHRGAPCRPGPLLLCGLSPGVLPMAPEAGGEEPDICILTLAMMIAGIPTVPVPGLREEDLIRAAQTFMMAHPEPEGPVEGVRWEQERAHPAPGHTQSLARPRRGQPPGSYL